MYLSELRWLNLEMGLWFRHLELEIGTGVLYYLYFTYKLTLKSGILGHWRFYLGIKVFPQNH